MKKRWGFGLLLLLGFTSCQKNWTCSCTCTYYQIGGTYNSSSTVYNANKLQAEGVCYNQQPDQDSCKCKLQ